MWTALKYTSAQINFKRSPYNPILKQKITGVYLGVSEMGWLI